MMSGNFQQQTQKKRYNEKQYFDRKMNGIAGMFILLAFASVNDAFGKQTYWVLRGGHAPDTLNQRE